MPENIRRKLECDTRLKSIKQEINTFFVWLTFITFDALIYNNHSCHGT